MIFKITVNGEEYTNRAGLLDRCNLKSEKGFLERHGHKIRTIEEGPRKHWYHVGDIDQARSQMIRRPRGTVK